MRNVTLPSVHETNATETRGGFSVCHIDELYFLAQSQDGGTTYYFLISSQKVDTLCECVCESKKVTYPPCIFRRLGFVLCECVCVSKVTHTHPVIFRCLGCVLCSIYTRWVLYWYEDISSLLRDRRQWCNNCVNLITTCTVWYNYSI